MTTFSIIVVQGYDLMIDDYLVVPNYQKLAIWQILDKTRNDNRFTLQNIQNGQIATMSKLSHAKVPNIKVLVK